MLLRDTGAPLEECNLVHRDGHGELLPALHAAAGQLQGRPRRHQLQPGASVRSVAWPQRNSGSGDWARGQMSVSVCCRLSAGSQ